MDALQLARRTVMKCISWEVKDDLEAAMYKLIAILAASIPIILF